MKIKDLLEMALQVPHPNKDAKLRAALTSENIKTHYEIVIQLIASAYSLKDLDEIVANINGIVPTSDDLEFYMNLIGKKLPVGAKRRTHGVFEAWFGKFVNPWSGTRRPAAAYDRHYEIGYNKGKWFVHYYVDAPHGVTFKDKTARFDTPEEALDYFQKTYPKLETNPSKW